MNVIESTKKSSNIFNTIILIFAISISLSTLIYAFEDIGAKLQNILNLAKKASLEPLPEPSKLLALQKSMFAKTPVTMSKEQIELGKILYFDPRLSGSKMLSCNSCHNISMYGTSLVNIDSRDKINPPTLFNSAFNDVAHYNGDISRFDKEAIESATIKTKNSKDSITIPAKNVIARASLIALSAKNEMAGELNSIVAMISNSSEYMAYFKRAYGMKTQVSPELIALSLSSFILSLNTFSRYDDFMGGNLRAMSIEEAQGLEIFINKGCVACHNGVGLGGTLQPFEVMKSYRYANVGSIKPNADNMLKVPTLRNITLTSPYFHNGMYERLDDAVREMANIQLGINISNKDIKALMAFFATLQGNIDIAMPALPQM